MELKAHFNQAPQFLHGQICGSCVTVTSADRGATEHLVSISLELVFAAKRAQTAVSHVSRGGFLQGHVFHRYGAACQNLMNLSPVLINPQSRREKKRWKRKCDGKKEEREYEEEEEEEEELSMVKEMSCM